VLTAYVSKVNGFVRESNGFARGVTAYVNKPNGFAKDMGYLF
jgi:hypothetical protein